MISYNRKTESLHKDKEVEYKVFIESAKEYMEINKTDKLPPYFITAMDIDWKDRVDIQSIIQKHTDTAISSTVNLKNEIRQEEVEQLYLYAWEKGLKGITIFRDGCNRSQILFGDSDKKEKTSKVMMSEIPSDTFYVKRKITHGCGTTHLFIGFSPSENKIVDVYNIAKMNGGCQKNITSQLILISQILRVGGDIREVQKTIDGIDTCASYYGARLRGVQVSEGRNCPSAMVKEIIKTEDELKNNSDNTIIVKNVDAENNLDKIAVPISKTTCPECGAELMPQGGCWSCQCGFSRCE
jgi:ribonucleoside-diphosphate reductase alpha chain